MSIRNRISKPGIVGSARRQFLLVALAVLAVMTLATAVSVTTASARAGDRPFSGVMVNNDTPGAPYPDFSTGDFQLRVDVDISGEINATHLGKGTVDGSVTIIIAPLVGEDACTQLAEGTIDFTAANGDELKMDMTVNELCFVTGQFTGQYEVYGGTGRFASASGTIDVSSVLVEGEPSVNTLTGTIVY